MHTLFGITLVLYLLKLSAGKKILIGDLVSLKQLQDTGYKIQDTGQPYMETTSIMMSTSEILSTLFCDKTQ